MAQVTLKSVFKTYPSEKGGEVIAVRDFNLEIKDKEFIVFVGPSGCGKSTTLRMIAGLEEISRGDVLIGERRVNDVPPKDRDIAMVFQNYALYPHMSVYDNMAFGLKLRKTPKEEIRNRVMDAAKILGISEYLERKPQALSGGQRQRVAVGRAIVRQPSVFLFDEPLSNLDAKMRVQMRAEITKLHRQLQATMIYVTHDQVEAMTMGERIVVMKDGIIQQVASPLEIYNQPANLFVAGFLGSPPMNFLHGTLRAENGKFLFHENNGPVVVDFTDHPSAQRFAGKSTTLGIRPEHCSHIQQPATTDKNPTFEAVVEIVEPMGAETFLYIHTGSHPLVSRIHETITRAEAGHRLHFQIDSSRAHLFDSESGLRIT
jgi:multiple sugar transport system ATP-binding protein